MNNKVFGRRRITVTGLLLLALSLALTLPALALVQTAPVVTGIPDQGIIEGGSFAPINLDDYVTDAEDAASVMIWTDSGKTDLIVVITDRVATISTPNADWNGVDTIVFRATDPGALSDEDTAIFTVTADNDPPEVSGIPGETIDEGGTFAAINLDNYVADVDDDDDQMTWTDSGKTDLIVVITDRVATISTPDSDWNGVDTIVFRATDPGALSDEDTAIFTVTAVNDPPVVSGIPDQSKVEGVAFETVNLAGHVTDVDNLASEMTWDYSGNTELSVSIDVSHIATIILPSSDWNGSETITFTATDPGDSVGSDAAVYTITPDNDAPIVTDIPNQTIDDGDSFATISLDDFVSDVDHDDTDMTWTVTGDVNLTVDITDRVATITYSGWIGSEIITFRATDPGPLFHEDAATFTVNAVPSLTGVLLEATSPNDQTTDDLICSYTLAGNAVTAATAWYVNSSPQMLVFLPMEGNATEALQDYSGNNLDATAVGNPTWSSTSGHDGNGAFEFDKVEDALIVPDDPDLDISHVTLSAWIYIDSYVHDQRIISREWGSGQPYSIYSLVVGGPSNRNLELRLGRNGENRVTIEGASDLPTGTWVHVAGTFDGSTAAVYVDGNLDASESVSGSLRSFSTPLYVGGSEFNSDAFFDGKIDDARVYDFGLSADQIEDLHDTGPDLIDSDETEIGDVWQARVTPFSTTDAGTMTMSNSLTIREILIPPVFTSTPLEAATEGLLYAYDANADGTPVPTYSLTTFPTGMTIDPVTGIFSWTPTNGQLGGPHSVTVVAANTAMPDAEQTFGITVSPPSPPDIDMFYGLTQSFGALGNPQIAIDILGNAVDLDGIGTLVYSLNGAADSNLSIGADGRRLLSPGDFCIEILTSDLIDGANTVVITATDIHGADSTVTVNVPYSAGNVWPMPYSIDWSLVSNINDTAQITDGLWELETDAVRTSIPGYDRLIAVGDTAWTDYQVQAPITVHSLEERGAVGFLLRWNGHTDLPVSAEGLQPKSGWLPLGAIMRYKTDQLQMFTNDNDVEASTPFSLTIGTTYIFKAQVETVSGVGGLYSLKVWEQGTLEPAAWDLVHQEQSGDPQAGSLLLFAHLADASFGDVTVSAPEVSFINSIQVVADKDSATVSWNTLASADSRVDFGLTAAYGDSVTDATMQTSHSLLLTGLTPKKTYHYMITSVDGGSTVHTTVDLTFQTAPSDSSGIVSDDFSDPTLNTTVWTFIDPLVDATLSMTGTGTADAWANIAVPAGVEHKFDDPDKNIARLMQPSLDANFEIEVKLESDLSTEIQMQGLLIEQDDNDFLRFEFFRLGSETKLFAAVYDDWASDTKLNKTFAGTAPLYMRVTRDNDDWTLSSSTDGSSWASEVTFTHTLVVTAVGPYAGNSGGSPPAHTASFDYFFETGSPVVPEDPENVPPVLDAVGPQAGPELTLIGFIATATDGDLPPQTLDFTLDDGTAGAVPPGAVITTGGVFSWTPTEAQGPDTYTFDVVVSDPFTEDRETIEVTVSEVNLPPVLDPLSDTMTVIEETELSFTATAADTDLPAQTLAFSLENGTAGSVPTGAAITTVGVFTWTPSEAQGPGNYTFDVVVTDGVDSVGETVTVVVEEGTNKPPVLTAIDDSTTIAEEVLFGFTATATDTDLPPQTLAFSLVDGASGTVPTGAVITTDGDFSWTPTEDQGPEIYTFDVVVSDGMAADSETVVLTVTETNSPPVLASIGPQTIVESTLLIIILSAEDTDLPVQPLTFSLENGTSGSVPAGAIISLGAFGWTPAPGQVGLHTFDIVVTDGVDEDRETITVEVTEIPIIVLPPVTEGVVDVPYSYDVDASGSPAPTYALVTFPAGMTIDPVTGAISWTPSSSGEFEVSVEALNSAGADTLDFTIDVDEIPTITTTAPTEGTVGKLYTYDVEATGDPIPTYDLQVSPSGMTIDAVTGEIEWTPDDTGTVDVTVRAFNTAGEYTEVFTIETTCRPFTLLLDGGWNYVSMNVVLEADSIMGTLLSVRSDIDILKQCDGDFCVPDLICQVGEWDALSAYKIHMSTSASVEFCGVPISCDSSISLTSGWNCVSYLPAEPISADTALVSIATCLDICKAPNGTFYIPEIELNSIGDMQEGFGYSMHMSCPDDLVYNCTGGAPKSVATLAIRPDPQHFRINNTADFHAVVIHATGGLVEGDEVGLYTQSGILVGSAVYTEGPIPIAAWEDNTESPERDGYVSGDRLSVRAWHKETGSEHAVVVELIAGSETFGNSPFTVLEVDFSGQGSQPLTFGLSVNYPNPFNPSTLIRFTLPAPGPTRLIVYNVVGQRVKSLVDEVMEAGEHEVRWHGVDETGNKVATGIYFYRLTSDFGTQTRKMLLLK